MIDYEEELKKFEPCLDVTDAEGAIYDRELTDILDVLQEVSKRSKKQQTGKIRYKEILHELYELRRISYRHGSGLLSEIVDIMY